MNKITLFLPSLVGGGAERMMIHLALGFAKQGHDVDLVLAKCEGDYLTLVPESVNIIDLQAESVLKSLLPLKRYLKQRQPEVILSTLSNANIILLLARLMTRGTGRVFVREANTMDINSIKAHPLRRGILVLLKFILYRTADKIITVSQGLADDIIRSYRLNDKSVQVIYNPVVDDDLFNSAKEPVDSPIFSEGTPIILGAGRLIGQKDFQTLIRAFAKVRENRKVKLIILGEGKLRKELEELTEILGLENDILLPGFVLNPFKFMKNADLFVLSSRWEGLPGVLIQAMACGCPVVSTECPNGPAEILESGRLGQLVPIGNVSAMADAIERSLDTPLSCRQRKTLIERAMNFNQTQAVNEYLEVFAGRVSD